MTSFTHSRYKSFLTALQQNRFQFLTFTQYLGEEYNPVDKICLIRHDVDRAAHLASQMAEIEDSLGILSTYYFRIKPVSFKEDTIRKIRSSGHEIGYHYENLSDHGGQFPEALDDFKVNLQRIRQIAEVSTVSMHGRPFSKHDNRDLWKDDRNHQILTEELGILGEIYLDIDYTNVVYISDTGRNWESSKHNKRDRVKSSKSYEFKSDIELLEFFQTTKEKRIVFQVHPERWSNSPMRWCYQFVFDSAANTLKGILP